ncbi:MAG TPA: DUF3348 domain-containing protein [Bordetella sp.]
MSKAPQRTPLPGPAFIRLLARLTDVDVPPSRHALSDRLSHWVDWNRAIVLSRALDGSPAPGTDAPAFGSTEEAECARLRTSLAQAILEAPELNPTAQSPDPGTADDPAPGPALDFSVFRKRYVARQQAMQTATGYLRGRLRDMLAAQSGERARLAEIDAVMELTLSPREQTLLAAVPTLLGEHFERLRQGEAPPAQDDTPPPQDPTPAAQRAWLEGFRRDMQQLLLAELDVRFQPIDGLLAALRTH